MKLPFATPLLAAISLGLSGASLAVAQDKDTARGPSIRLPSSNTGACCSFGSAPRIFIEIEQSGKISLNSKPINDLSAIDDYLNSLPIAGKKWLKVIFHGDHLASAELFVTIVSQLERQIERLDVILAVIDEHSGRECHLGATLLQDESSSQTNKAKTPGQVDVSSPLSIAGELPSNAEVASGTELFHVAVNADGSFTTDAGKFDKLELLDQWQLIDTTARMLDEALHVYAEFDQECTFQHVATLLDTAARASSSAQFAFSLAKPTAKEK